MHDPQQQGPPRAEQARTWRRYLRFFGPRGLADLDDELAFHVEMRTRDAMARGMSAEAARAAAHERLGDLQAARAECAVVTTRTQRRMTRTQIIDALAQDLRFALRTLGRNKGWTAVAVLTLALGIGANTAMFSVVNHLLLNPLPYPNADRVAVVFQAASQNTTAHNVMVTPKPKLIEAWREHAKTLEAIEPYRTEDLTVERTGSDPRIAPVAHVLPSFASFAGKRPVRGRLFTAEEAKGAPTVALLAEGTWRREFGGRDDAIGSRVMLDGQVVTIIGVMPATLALPRSHEGAVEYWLPLDMSRHPFGMLTVARLREGVTIEAAKRELDAIAASPEVATQDASTYRTELRSPAEMIGLKPSLIMLSIAVGLVLLIACANVIHLLLARASTRERELSIRAALGAGRARLFRQLLTESALLSLAGGAIGLLLGWAGLEALLAARPESLGDLAAVRLDGATLAVTVLISIATGLLFGVVGAVQAARHSTHDALKAGALSTTGGRARGRARALIVVTEMAVCTMLLVGAVLLLRSVMHLQSMDPGFRPEGLYAIELPLPEDRYKTNAEKAAFDAEVLRRAQQAPGVAQATLVASAPPRSAFLLGALQLEGEAPPPAGATGLLQFNGVAPEFFAMAGIRLLEGTTFTDTSEAAAQAIVNQGMARRFWKGQSPIGKRLRIVYNGEGEWRTVVGVADDARLSGLTNDAGEPILYLPGNSGFRPALLVRVAEGANFIPKIDVIPRAIDPRLPPPQVRDIADVMRRSMSRVRFTLLLLGIFAGVAVGLAAIGLYGVLAYNVAQRTREIGIRIALGAGRQSVAGAVLRQAIVLVVVGSAIGLLVARGGTRLLAHTLYGVQATDPGAFIAAAAALLVIAVLACVVPVRRAVSVDPVIAMRAD